MFIKPQRPTAPWSNHNYWGQFDSAANLPNTATSDIQVSSTELQQGDVAWAQAELKLYVCINPAAGSAQWVAMPQDTPVPSSSVQLWVDGDNGSDSNPGTQAEPLQTVDAALSRVPTYLDRDYVVHILEAPVQGAYQAPSLEREFFCGAFRLALVGEAYTVIDSGTLTGFTNSQANPWLLEDNTQAWSDDEHIVRFIRFTSGAATGSLVSVVENDATTIRTAGAISAPSIGDSYQIVRPAVRLEGFANIGGAEVINGATVFSSSPAFDNDLGGVTFVNLEMGSLSAGLFASGFIQVFGSVMTSGATINTGRAGFPADLSYLNTSVISQGQGAGLVCDLSGSLLVQGDFAGVLNAPNISQFFVSQPSVYKAVVEIVSGRLWRGTSNGSLWATTGRLIKLGTFLNSAPTYGRVLVRAGLGETMALGAMVERGGTLDCQESAFISCNDAGSIGVRVRGTGKAAFDNSTIDGDSRGLLTEGGGRATFTRNGGNITTAGSNVAAVEANGTTADTGAAGAFTTDLNFVVSATGDLSAIHRVDE